MSIVNSYIFLSNPDKETNTQKNKSVKNNNSIKIDVISDSFFSCINSCFKNLQRTNYSMGHYKYEGSFETKKDVFKIFLEYYKINESFFLDLEIIENNKTKAISCLEQINNFLESSDANEDYIIINTYDSVSEFYCNKMYPKLNALERNLRKLLFNTYILNFGKEYYSKTISKDIQDKAKKLIAAKGNQEKKEKERLKNFFYSLDFYDIQTLLFIPSWTEIEECKKKDFLTNNKNLSELSDEELRNFISKLSPQTEWDRFFSSKIKNQNVNEMINEIREHRNNVAHCKFFKKSDYSKCYNTINELNKEILSAIEITKEEDFVNKITENTFSFISESLLNKLGKLGEAMNKLAVKASLNLGTQITNLLNSQIINSISKLSENLASLYINEE